jgi:hypothetical protein
MCFAVGMISNSLVTWESFLFRRMFNLPEFPNRNMFFWAKQNSYYTTDTEDHTSHVMMWSGVADSRVIGPYFFDGTVNGVS